MDRIINAMTRVAPACVSRGTPRNTVKPQTNSVIPINR